MEFSDKRRGLSVTEKMEDDNGQEKNEEIKWRRQWMTRREKKERLGERKEREERTVEEKIRERRQERREK